MKEQAFALFVTGASVVIDAVACSKILVEHGRARPSQDRGRHLLMTAARTQSPPDGVACLAFGKEKAAI